MMNLAPPSTDGDVDGTDRSLCPLPIRRSNDSSDGGRGLVFCPTAAAANNPPPPGDPLEEPFHPSGGELCSLQSSMAVYFRLVGTGVGASLHRQSSRAIQVSFPCGGDEISSGTLELFSRLWSGFLGTAPLFPLPLAFWRYLLPPFLLSSPNGDETFRVDSSPNFA